MKNIPIWSLTEIHRLPEGLLGVSKNWSSLVAQRVKNPSAMRETWVQSLGWKYALEEETTTPSSILAWRIPMDREAWQATVNGIARVRYD